MGHKINRHFFLPINTPSTETGESVLADRDLCSENEKGGNERGVTQSHAAKRSTMRLTHALHNETQEYLERLFSCPFSDANSEVCA